MVKKVIPTIGSIVKVENRGDIQHVVVEINKNDYSTVRVYCDDYGVDNFNIDKVEIIDRPRKNSKIVRVPLLVENNPMIQGLISKIPNNLSKQQKLMLDSMSDSEKLDYVGSFMGFKSKVLPEKLKVTGGVDATTITRKDSIEIKEKLSIVNALTPKQLLEFKRKFEFEENNTKSNIMFTLDLEEIKSCINEENNEIPF